MDNITSFFRKLFPDKEPTGKLPFACKTKTKTNQITTSKVVLYGDQATGKSEFLKSIMDQDHVAPGQRDVKRTIEYPKCFYLPIKKIISEYDGDEYKPTIGIDFGITTFQENIKLQIWDASGNENYRKIVLSYMRGNVFVILFFDVSSRASFENLDNWMSLIQQYSSHEDQVVIVGTKTDQKRQVSTREIADYARQQNIKYYETGNDSSTNSKIIILMLRASEMQRFSQEKSG